MALNPARLPIPPNSQHKKNIINAKAQQKTSLIKAILSSSCPNKIKLTSSEAKELREVHEQKASSSIAKPTKLTKANISKNKTT